MHVNSDCVESDDDPLALAFLSLRFLSASQILFDSNCAAYLLMRQRYFVQSCAAFYPGLNWNIEIFKRSFMDAFVAFLLTTFIWHSCNIGSLLKLYKFQ